MYIDCLPENTVAPTHIPIPKTEIFTVLCTARATPITMKIKVIVKSQRKISSPYIIARIYTLTTVVDLIIVKVDRLIYISEEFESMTSKAVADPIGIITEKSVA
jgi:hypothetical protein